MAVVPVFQVSGTTFINVCKWNEENTSNDHFSQDNTDTFTANMEFNFQPVTTTSFRQRFTCKEKA